MKKHRGRLQVQGEDMKGKELSKKWAQSEPKKAAIALAELETLKSECSEKQRTARIKFFLKARTFIEMVCAEGGWCVGDAGSLDRSFPPRKRADKQGRRVDIEIKAGMAFVP